jgi:hypothetical protein
MRLSIALAVLVLSLPTEVTEAKSVSSPRPKTSVDSENTGSVQANRPINAEAKPAAAAMALEAPKNIFASLIRSQGYACDSPQSAEYDVAASEAHEVVWMLDCGSASYRVTIIPGIGAKVDKVGEASPSSSSSGH